MTALAGTPRTAARYEGLASVDVRWCQRCAGAQLRAMTLSLNTAARGLAREHLAPHRHLALPTELVPIFDEALRRLGR